MDAPPVRGGARHPGVHSRVALGQALPDTSVRVASEGGVHELCMDACKWIR